jgi:hypothetical protein
MQSISAPAWHAPTFEEGLLGARVKARVLICMLACCLTWHLRRTWAPLTFTDEHPPVPANPDVPGRHSAAARARRHTSTTQPTALPHTFRGLLEHLAP